MNGSTAQPGGRGTDPAPAVLELASAGEPACGPVRVVAVDGPAGSGKTTFAAALEAAAQERGLTTCVLHMDDLYAGWDGLRAGGASLTRVLRDLAVGRPAAYRRYDWERGAYVETVPVPVRDVLVVEGVGSVRSEHADLLSVVVWVEEPDSGERMRRGIERDGEHMRAQWVAWMATEQSLFAEVGTRDLADVRIDGRGRHV